MTTPKPNLTWIQQTKIHTYRESLALRYQIHKPADQWWEKAACKGIDTNLFYQESGTGTLYAAHICAKCPVLLDCGAAAWAEESSTDYTFGTRAGMPANARKRWYTKLRAQTVGWINHPSWR
jgi:hypothetical protein